MKLIGITRVRNEAGVIENTLNHLQGIVEEVIVYDDASTDDTVSICQSHTLVSSVIRNHVWDSSTEGRSMAEGHQRNLLYIAAKRHEADWVYYFDADEYVEFENIDFTADSYYFRLFDFYITSEDIGDVYLNRKWMGPEYRDIPMLFRANNAIRFTQRVPRNYGVAEFGGYVKHYGKAISIQRWEEDCEYYSQIRWKGRNKELQDRWEKRRGRAVHTMSDFGRPLITWEERKSNVIVKI